MDTGVGDVISVCVSNQDCLIPCKSSAGTDSSDLGHNQIWKNLEFVQ